MKKQARAARKLDAAQKAAFIVIINIFLMMEKIIFTIPQYKALENTISVSQQALNNVIAEKNETGKGSDGWHDELFKDAISREIMWGRRVKELTDLKRKAKIVKPSAQNAEIAVGNTVILLYDNKTRKELVIDGYIIDAPSNHISIYSPLGKILLGKKTGQKFIFHAPIGQQEITIKSIACHIL
jgi:transcription elongation GreA/GreB family factor